MSQSDSSSIAPAYILHAETVYTLFCPQFFSHLLSIDYRLFNVSLFIPLSLCRTADSNSHLSRPTQNPNSSVKDKRRSIAKRPSVAFYYAVIYFLLFFLCVCVCMFVLELLQVANLLFPSRWRWRRGHWSLISHGYYLRRHVIGCCQVITC